MNIHIANIDCGVLDARIAHPQHGAQAMGQLSTTRHQSLATHDPRQNAYHSKKYSCKQIIESLTKL